MAIAERFLIPGAQTTLVDQIVQWYGARVDDRSLRPGTRLPSIRQFAQQHQVSRFTVVEAYDRLVARGFAESRRGAGFYVLEREHLRSTHPARPWAELPQPRIDVVWLLRNMFRQMPARDMPGGGTLPRDWLDESLIESSLRSVAKSRAGSLVDYGQPQGYAPLRQQLQLKLDDLGIAAPPEQILMTHGVTQALDLIAQHMLKPGDVVLVDEPSWFVMFGRFALLGATIIGVPRTPSGPDCARLRELAKLHKPRMFVVMSALHNPTSTSMNAACAYQVLKIAAEFDFLLVEDDVYGDLHSPQSAAAGIRLAALDQLQRVIYLSGFAKTLSANLRVGFAAGPPDLIRRLTDLKMLVGLTTPELGERVVYRILSQGHYRRHLDRLRARLGRVRDTTIRELERVGLKLFADTSAGMFVWMDAAQDTNVLAQVLMESGYLLAPGALFMPDQRPSTWLRFNVATSRNPKMLAALSTALAAG